MYALILLTLFKNLYFLESGPFYFESDALALRNNTDYSCLLKTLILLESQRIQASKDLDTLYELKDKSLSNPIEFIECLKDNDRFALNSLVEKIPQRQKVYLIPEIDFDKYYESIDLEDLEIIKKHKEIRAHSLRQTSKLTYPAEKQNSLSEKFLQIKEKNEFKEEKGNHNKPWTVEEQRHLEELLLEFPPEENEAQRCRKIANKLGTRTALQVQSHCQKYFIKLGNFI